MSTAFSEPMLPFIRSKLARLKNASRGAKISLINEGNTYAAYLGDAVAARDISGPTMGKLHNIGDIPVYRISYHQINAFLKLAENLASVALLDTETNGSTSKVECVFYQAKTPTVKAEVLVVTPNEDDLLLADIYGDDFLGDIPDAGMDDDLLGDLL